MYTRQYTLFAGGSDLTSDVVLTADAQALSLSVGSNTTIAVNWTLEGSNEDGFGSSLVTFSTISTIVADGIYVVEVGARWTRLIRESATSQPFASLQFRAP